MSIIYSIFKNNLNNSGNSPYISRSRKFKKVTLSEVEKQMAFGSTITLPDIKAVIESMQRVLMENLLSGNSVDLGFAVFSTHVKGGFESEKDTFRAGRNTVGMRVRIVNEFKKLFASTVW